MGLDEGFVKQAQLIDVKDSSLSELKAWLDGLSHLGRAVGAVYLDKALDGVLSKGFEPLACYERLMLFLEPTSKLSDSIFFYYQEPKLD